VFSILKFRTMRDDAESDGRPRWAMPDDKRVTSVGRFLRRSRLDEIPQAWNVLCGEMSVVGPRPERPEFVAELAAVIPYYRERHHARPGITGWAQINCAYGSSLNDARLKLGYDLYYLKNRSFSLDLLILVRTIGTVLLGEGAR
jgi:lipopolysaccharide/colanic/teichoic acid biosynthesis glycosyltransferase